MRAVGPLRPARPRRARQRARGPLAPRSRVRACVPRPCWTTPCSVALPAQQCVVTCPLVPSRPSPPRAHAHTRNRTYDLLRKARNQSLLLFAKQSTKKKRSAPAPRVSKPRVNTTDSSGGRCVFRPTRAVLLESPHLPAHLVVRARTVLTIGFVFVAALCTHCQNKKKQPHAARAARP